MNLYDKLITVEKFYTVKPHQRLVVRHRCL